MGMFNKLTDHCKLINNGEIEYYVIDKMDEVKAEMLRLLSIVDSICREKELKYWIDGGTLIGAIRHGGFIPWDDDIDISMPKPDYRVLINELEKKSVISDKNVYLLFSGVNRNQHCCNYLCSKKNLYGRKRGSFGVVPIKLDIRPLNIIKNSREDIILNQELREIANVHLFNKSYGKLTNLSKTFQEMTKEQFFDFYNNDYGFINDKEKIMSFPYYEFASEDFLPINMMDNLQRIKFENISTLIPTNYKNYLTSLYGEFMSLPPLSSRVPAQYEYLEFPQSGKKLDNIINKVIQNTAHKMLCFLSLYGLKKTLSIIEERYQKIL